jgi:hypothetical protein
MVDGPMTDNAQGPMKTAKRARFSAAVFSADKMAGASSLRTRFFEAKV